MVTVDHNKKPHSEGWPFRAAVLITSGLSTPNPGSGAARFGAAVDGCLYDPKARSAEGAEPTKQLVTS